MGNKKPIKEKKERSKKHEEKLKINTTLNDVLKASIPKRKNSTSVLTVGWGKHNNRV